MQLPTINVTGTPSAMGEQHGEAFREMIVAFVAERLRAAKVYLWERGNRDGEGLLVTAAECLAATAAWAPSAVEEHHGIARAAGVDPVDLFLASNLTDIRDALLLGPAGSTSPADAEGCTCVVAPPALTMGGHWLVGQTWDLNPGDVDAVVAIHRLPADGPETWSVTCAGSLSLVGMNQHGVMVGTTNIKTTGSRVGVPYLPILHQALASRDRASAAAVVDTAPRAGAHTYLTADATGATQFECTATTAVRREVSTDVALAQTNHCLEADHQAREAEPASGSSTTRLDTARARLAAGELDQAAIRRLFAERDHGADSINRYPEDQTGTATNSCLIAEPASRHLWACRGPADRGEWVELPFERSAD